MLSKKILFGLSLLILLLFLTPAYADWDPRDNITLRDFYSINDGVLAYFDYYYGDGSHLTGITPDNTSWNESYADTLYATIGYGADWNKTYADTLYSAITWNKTYADTLYAGIEWDYNMTDEVETLYGSDYRTTFNSTYAALITNDYTWNKTYADTLYADISVTGDDAEWNKTYADTLYAGIEWDYNMTDEVETLYGADYRTTFNSTYAALITNDYTWNKTYADTLYEVQLDNEAGLYAVLSDVDDFLQSLHDDTSPQLGGYLDTDGENIGATDDEIENVYVATGSIIYFGDGQEANIQYNGTNLVITG